METKEGKGKELFSTITDKELEEAIKWMRANNTLSTKPEPCPNCKETSKDCACMRNKCIKCGGSVGNITFTQCDECWNKSEPKESQEHTIDEFRHALRYAYGEIESYMDLLSRALPEINSIYAHYPLAETKTLLQDINLKLGIDVQKGFGTPKESPDELWEYAQKEVHEYIIRQQSKGLATGRIEEFNFLKKLFTITRNPK